jgi:hypothetical protein
VAVDVLGENDVFVTQLRHSIRAGSAGLADVPMLLKAVLRDGRWKERRIKTGEHVPFDRFEDFVTRPPLEGLGADMPLIKRICADDPEAVNLLDEAIGSHQGERTDFVDTINEVEPRPDGTSAKQALRRLRKDRPDLHARVLARELSPHRAMIEAGFRPRTITLTLAPEAATRLIVKHFKGPDLEALIRGLANWAGIELAETETLND